MWASDGEPTAHSNMRRVHSERTPHPSVIRVHEDREQSKGVFPELVSATVFVCGASVPPHRALTASNGLQQLGEGDQMTVAQHATFRNTFAMTRLGEAKMYYTRVGGVAEDEVLFSANLKFHPHADKLQIRPRRQEPF